MADDLSYPYLVGRTFALPSLLARKAAGAARDAIVPAAQDFYRGLTGLPTMNVPSPEPAKTSNAVANAQNADSQTDRAPGKAQAPGQSQAPGPGFTGSVSPGGLPYFTKPTSVAGIEQINAKGQSPLFTNMGAAGLDDLSQMRSSPLPSVQGFLAGVPTFGSGARAGANTTAASPTPPAVSVIHPSIYNAIDEYERAAQPLLNSAGIVDRLRGRQLIRARARLVNDLTSVAGAETGAAHAAASLGVANVAQQRADEEARQNLAANYLRSQEISTQARGQELQFLPHLEQAVVGRQIQNAAQSGDLDLQERLMRAGRFPPQSRNPTALFDPTGQNVVVIHPGEAKPRAYKLPSLMVEDQKKKDELAGLATQR